MNLEKIPAPYVPMSRDRLTARKAALLQEIGREGRVSPPPGRRLAIPAAVVALGVGAWMGVSWFTGASSAYASWTPAAQRLSIAAAHGPADSCVRRLSGMHQAPQTSRMAPVLAERRGAFTAVLVGGPSTIGVCLDGAASWMTGYTRSPALTSGARLLLTGDGGKTDAPDAARYVYGRAASGVTAVVVTTSDGNTVTATVSSGYFFAWWPSGASPRAITATGAAGDQLARLAPPAVPVP